MPFSGSFLNENTTTFLCKIFLQKKNLFIFDESAYQSFKKNSTSFKSTPYMQSNLCKTTTLGNTQKWSSWTSGRLIKHLYKTNTKRMWSLWFLVFIPTADVL